MAVKYRNFQSRNWKTIISTNNILVRKRYHTKLLWQNVIIYGNEIIDTHYFVPLLTCPMPILHRWDDDDDKPSRPCSSRWRYDDSSDAEEMTGSSDHDSSPTTSSSCLGHLVSPLYHHRKQKFHHIIWGFKPFKTSNAYDSKIHMLVGVVFQN